MDLNHIQLSPSLVAEFYGRHLVENPGLPPLEAVLPPNAFAKKDIQYLGKNLKEICLLVHYPKDVYLPDNQLDFLTNILQACQLNVGDVAIVNHFRGSPTFDDLTQQLSCKYLLIFGVEPAVIGLAEIPLFTIVHINDCRIVISPDAAELNKNDAAGKLLKGKLWICLKQLFNV